MNLIEHVELHFSANIQTCTEALPLLAGPIAAGSSLLIECLLQGGKILCCGNGGSAANAQRFAALMLNRFERERPGLPAIALNSDTNALTSISDYYDYDEACSRQVQALGHNGDILLAISCSGNAENINAAVDAAHEREMRVIALTGGEGGRISTLLRNEDMEIRAPSRSDARTEEVHLLTIHCLCDLVDQQLLGES